MTQMRSFAGAITDHKHKKGFRLKPPDFLLGTCTVHAFYWVTLHAFVDCYFVLKINFFGKQSFTYTDLRQNNLQMLSVDDTCRQRVNRQ